MTNATQVIEVKRVMEFYSPKAGVEVGPHSRPTCRKIAATLANKDLSKFVMSFRINLGQLES